jgi:hypothetical protein
MRRLLPIFVLAAAALPASAMAQPGKDGPNPVGPSGPLDTEKVKMVYVYGEDPCPASAADEIQICARLPDTERYRIPKELRGDPLAPQNQSWAVRAKSLETVGASGINSCSTAGAGGWTGCFQKLAREAKEERKTMLGTATWADAVQKERDKRLGTIDADSAKIEAEAKAAEANKAADDKAAAEARARLEQQDKSAGTK